MSQGHGYMYPSPMLGNTVQGPPQPTPWQRSTSPTRSIYQDRPGSPVQGMIPRSGSPFMLPQMGTPPPMIPRSISPGRPVVVIQQSIDHRSRNPYVQYGPPQRTASPPAPAPRSASPQPTDRVWFYAPHLQHPPGTPPLGRHVSQIDINRPQPQDNYVQRREPQSANLHNYYQPPPYNPQYAPSPRSSPPPAEYQPQQYMAPSRSSPPPAEYQPQQYMAPSRSSPPPAEYQPQQYMAPSRSPPPQRSQYTYPPQPRPQPSQYQQQYMAPPPPQRQPAQYPEDANLEPLPYNAPYQMPPEPYRAPRQPPPSPPPPPQAAHTIDYDQPPTVQNLPPRYMSPEELQNPGLGQYQPARQPPQQPPQPTCGCVAPHPGLTCNCVARAMEPQGHGM